MTIILLQESATSRIVQRKHQYYSDTWIVARERLVLVNHLFWTKAKWEAVSYLFSNACETLEQYINYFNYQDELDAKSMGVFQSSFCKGKSAQRPSTNTHL